MASEIRYIQKALICEEDLLVGQGTAVQSRNGTDYTLNKINAESIPYSGDAVTSDFVSILTKIDALEARIAVLEGA